MSRDVFRVPTYRLRFRTRRTSIRPTSAAYATVAAAASEVANGNVDRKRQSDLFPTYSLQSCRRQLANPWLPTAQRAQAVEFLSERIDLGKHLGSGHPTRYPTNALRVAYRQHTLRRSDFKDLIDLGYLVLEWQPGYTANAVGWSNCCAAATKSARKLLKSSPWACHSPFFHRQSKPISDTSGTRCSTAVRVLASRLLVSRGQQ